MNSSRSGVLVLSVILGALAASCASAPPERRLDSQSREFLSKVRFIITAEERKAFQNTAPENRAAFIEDFWKRRDPTPNTAENEYKLEYFQRIDQATKLFSGGGSPGWLQDRGRVYILLGPPDNRVTYPRGVTFYGSPTEVWWYGFFTIAFVDEAWVDDYRLTPDSAVQMAEINKSQLMWNEARDKKIKTPAPVAMPPDLDLKIEKDPAGGAKIVLTLPYKNIWMKAKDASFQTTLELELKAVDAGGAEAWSFSEKYPFDITEARMKELLTKDYVISVAAPLKPGAYTLRLSLINTVDGAKASLDRKFEI